MVASLAFSFRVQLESAFFCLAFWILKSWFWLEILCEIVASEFVALCRFESNLFEQMSNLFNIGRKSKVPTRLRHDLICCT